MGPLSSYIKMHYSVVVHFDILVDDREHSGFPRIKINILRMHTFSKKEALLFGWQTAKSNIVFFIVLLIIVGVLSGGSSAVSESFKEDSPAIVFVINFVTTILGIILGMGVIKIALTFVDGGKGRFGDLFSQYRLFFKYLMGSILYGLIVLAGLILLVIPGIIWGIKFQFYSYLIVDKGMGPIEAIKKSGQMTSGVKLNLFLFSLLLGLVNAAGALLLGIGLLWSIPTSWVATAWVYRKLLNQKRGQVRQKKAQKFSWRKIFVFT